MLLIGEDVRGDPGSVVRHQVVDRGTVDGVDVLLVNVADHIFKSKGRNITARSVS